MGGVFPSIQDRDPLPSTNQLLHKNYIDAIIHATPSKKYDINPNLSGTVIRSIGTVPTHFMPSFVTTTIPTFAPDAVGVPRMRALKRRFSILLPGTPD